ncbi:hypothetical protein RRG08_017905 [Elysia crispata]|uniref:Uncharacterized protein n=1 Tax=Elysia crispata TaxID=231223 RepID=A0AAE1AC67_9GAST|nr:hypothetical protein RRG08_017905 [Elysia crispata]
MKTDCSDTIQTEPLDLSVRGRRDSLPERNECQVKKPEPFHSGSWSRAGWKCEKLNNIISNIRERTSRTCETYPAGKTPVRTAGVLRESQAFSSTEQVYSGESLGSTRCHYPLASETQQPHHPPPLTSFNESDLQVLTQAQLLPSATGSQEPLTPKNRQHQVIRPTPVYAWDVHGPAGQVPYAQSRYSLDQTPHRLQEWLISKELYANPEAADIDSVKLLTPVKNDRNGKSHDKLTVSGKENNNYDSKCLTTSLTPKHSSEILGVRGDTFEAGRNVLDTRGKGAALTRLYSGNPPQGGTSSGISWPVTSGCTPSTPSHTLADPRGVPYSEASSHGSLCANQTRDVETTRPPLPPALGPMQLPVKLPDSQGSQDLVAAAIRPGLHKMSARTLAKAKTSSSPAETLRPAPPRSQSAQRLDTETYRCAEKNTVTPEVIDARDAKPSRGRSLLFDRSQYRSKTSTFREIRPHPGQKRPFGVIFSGGIGQETSPGNNNFPGLAASDSNPAPPEPVCIFPSGNSSTGFTPPIIHGFLCSRKERSMTIYTYGSNFQPLLATQLEVNTPTSGAQKSSGQNQQDASSKKPAPSPYRDTSGEDRALLESMRTSGLISRHASGCIFLLAQMEAAKASRHTRDFKTLQVPQGVTCECTPCQTCKVMFRTKYRAFSHQLRGCTLPLFTLPD